MMKKKTPLIVCELVNDKTASPHSKRVHKEPHQRNSTKEIIAQTDSGKQSGENEKMDSDS